MCTGGGGLGLTPRPPPSPMRYGEGESAALLRFQLGDVGRPGFGLRDDIQTDKLIEGCHEALRDRAGCAGAEHLPFKARHRHDTRGRGGEEGFIGIEQVVWLQVALQHGNTQVGR